MPKYSSRIGSSNIPTKPKKMSVVPSSKELPQGAALPTAGAITSGGVINLPKVASVVKAVVGKVKQSVAAKKDEKGGAIKTAGAISSGGAILPTPKRAGTTRPADDNKFSIQITPESAMRLGYMPYIHALGAMNPQDFHLLQGLAAAYMPSVAHPMKSLAVSQIGGSFKLPRSISRVAHKDILKSVTSAQLSNALWMEMQEQGKSQKGGALLDSLRNLFSKAASGARRGGTALVKGVKTGVQVASAGLGLGLNVATRLNMALITGLAIAESASPIAQLVLGEEVKGPIRAGIDFVRSGQEQLQAGIDIGSAVQTFSDPLVQQLVDQEFGLQGIADPIVVEPEPFQ